ncbi:MAG: 2-hydroxyacid dehydrogenase [Pseudomonadota bacterium]
MTAELLLIGGATPRMMDRFQAEFTVHELRQIENRAAFLAERGAAITAVATNGHDGVPADIMAALPNLQIISCYGVGYDAIDVETAVARGIVVTHTPDVLNDEVANTAILMMLALYRDFLANESHARSGQWAVQGNAPLSRSPSRRTVGILGLGRIGMTIAEKLQAFDAVILYHARSQKDVGYTYYQNLIEMARDADILIVITPGGAATRHLVDRRVLDALGPEGTLINVARGSVVDEAELVLALKEGRLGYAGLDVFENEPMVPDELLSMQNVVLLPHVGSATVETRQAMGDLVCHNLSQFLKDGSPVTPIPECRT